MNDRNWTPGPWNWRVEGSSWDQEWYLDPAILAAAGSDGTPGGYGIDRANAHLIAAAPDLYEALEIAVFWLEVDGRYDVQGMKHALAKARGEAE